MACEICGGKGWIPCYPGDHHGLPCEACTDPALLNGTPPRRRNSGDPVRNGEVHQGRPSKRQAVELTRSMSTGLFQNNNVKLHTHARRRAR